MYRVYADDSLKRLNIIRLYKRLGYSLKDMKPMIDRLMHQASSSEESRAELGEQLLEIDARIEELNRIRRHLISNIINI